VSFYFEVPLVLYSCLGHAGSTHQAIHNLKVPVAQSLVHSHNPRRALAATHSDTHVIELAAVFQIIHTLTDRMPGTQTLGGARNATWHGEQTPAPAVPMRERKRVVTTWLEHTFDTIPQFELTDRAVTELYPAASSAAAADADAAVLESDLEHRATEYEAETVRVDRLLAAVGIHPGALSAGGSASAAALAHLADTLDLRTARQDELLSALAVAAAQSVTATLAASAGARTVDAVAAAVEHTERRSTQLADVMEGLEELASVEVTQAADRRARMGGLEQKINEYSAQIKELEQQIRSAGYDDALAHSALVREAQRSADFANATRTLSRQVATYAGLPADMSLAAAKLEDVRRLNVSKPHPGQQRYLCISHVFFLLYLRPRVHICAHTQASLDVQLRNGLR
jgi:hypothetical protein